MCFKSVQPPTEMGLERANFERLRVRRKGLKGKGRKWLAGAHQFLFKKENRKDKIEKRYTLRFPVKIYITWNRPYMRAHHCLLMS